MQHRSRTSTPIRAVASALALMAACSGCAGGSDRPNVLLITVDSLRADHLGCYGYERSTSPHLDAFAEEAVRFDRAYSHAPFTPPSHASLLTSLHTESHGIFGWEESLSDEARTLGERYGDAGYRTGAFYNHPSLLRSNITRGFDRVERRWFEPGGETVDSFLEWVDAEHEPFAAWMHLWDVHRPYGYRDWSPDYMREHVQREPDRMAFEETRFGDHAQPQLGRTEATYNLNRAERAGPRRIDAANQRVLDEVDYRFLSDRYDGGVYYADRVLGDLFEALEARGLLANTVVAITADHGESLTEREACYYTHDPFLYEETLHVPLLIRFPNGEFGGVVVEDLARGVDVLPSLLESTDHGTRRGDQGVSLLPAVRRAAAGQIGPERHRVLLAQTQTKNAKERDERVRDGEAWLEYRRALCDGRWKLIHDVVLDRYELYDLEADRREERDLASDEAAQVELTRLREILEAQLSALPAADGKRGTLTAEEREILQTLGYTGD